MITDPPTPGPEEAAGKILLVDDEATNLHVLRETLAGPNYHLFVARSGEEALKVARRAKPSLVLLDVVMPGIDGYETCRRLKEDPDTRDAAVIFLSALNDPKDQVRGFEAGAVDFISKPVQAEEVVARVNTHLAIQRLLRRQVERRSSDCRAGRPAPRRGRPSPAAMEARPPGTSVFRTGEVVAFRFRIVRYLAKGGMGELYMAEDLELRERVALKTILPHIADDERSILMFKREVHLARQVTHPNVCRIYDVFRHRYAASADRPGEEVVFLAMELLQGETLADKLHREGRFATGELLPVVRQMAAALTAAHRVGVVHRDFKSLNVMLVKPTRADEGMRVVVTDFGLAWRSAQGESTSVLLSLSLPEEDVISGTPAYMAPEQVEGGPVTPATDVYALGVVLYEMVTGVWPFVGETPLKTAIKRLKELPPSPRVHVPDVDPLWEATILRCLARRPEDRFASANDVVSALEGAPPSANAAPAPTPTPSRRDSETPPVRRSGGEAERRQLTVLVSGCEVFESDAYLELDSEDQARMLRSFQERCEGAVVQFGGTVVQCTDKGLLACFGFPVAYEDAAGRAARAGSRDPRCHEALTRAEGPPRHADAGSVDRYSHRSSGRRVQSGRRVAGGRCTERGRPSRRRGRRRSDHLYRGQPPPVPGTVSLRLPRAAEDPECHQSGRTVSDRAHRGGRKSDRRGDAGGTLPSDWPRPGDRPAHESLGAGPGRHGAGRPAQWRTGPGQIAPRPHDEAPRPGTDD